MENRVKNEKKQVKRLARLHPKWPQAPTSVINYLNQRSLNGRETHQCQRLKESLSNRKVPFLWKEKEYNLGEINKVFASLWISDDEVVMGTKCNKLMILDTVTGKKNCIPMIKSTQSTENESEEFDRSGIHGIALNPSQSFLATGADNPNNLAVYSMPGFHPVCVGEDCHKDWIFDVKWLDDEFVTTGSRDGSIALWSIADAQKCKYENQTGESSSSVKSILPRCKKTLSVESHLNEDDHARQKVRALEFNKKRKELASVVVDSGCITFWDVKQFREVLCRKLPHSRESVCMSLSDTYSLYAVGSQSHITLLDSRKAKNVGTLSTWESCSGVRSLTFQGDVLSAGTGMGAIKFIDIRRMKYLQDKNDKEIDKEILKVGKGWLSMDGIYYSYFHDAEYRNAIYTHSYDHSGMRLFAAGGPLPSGLTGNYAGLFH